MSLPKLDDFDTTAVGPITGKHGQQIIDALRILDNQAGYDSSMPHPYWDMLETWPAIVVGLNAKPGESESDLPVVQPAMYWVRKQYIGSGLTADSVNLYNALDDPTMFYPATNVLEMLDGTNTVKMGQPVLILVYIDRGVTNRKRYLFIADRPVAWIKITSAMGPASAGTPHVGGGAWYNARSVTGVPVTIDPTTDLVAPIAPSETVAASDNLLAMNWAESNFGDPPSHWVQCPAFVPAWLIGYSNESPPRPAYRFYVPRPGMIDGVVLAVLGSSGGGGAGRYQIGVMLGSVAGLDQTTNFHGTDPGTRYPGSYNAYWTDVYEGGSGSNGTNIITVGSFIRGSFVGMATDGTPVFYGSSAPSGALFRVKLVQNGGSQGTASAAATWTYDVWVFDNSLQLLSAAPVEAPRFAIGTMTAATMGLAYLSATGAVVLAQAWEVHGTVTCS